MLKKVTLRVVDPYALPSYKEVKAEEQLLVQFKNGKYGIGTVKADLVNGGQKGWVERLVLHYGQGRAHRMEVLPGQDL